MQFTKQLIMYLDKTITPETINFNLKLSEAISEILSKIRYYPYPVVMYKIVLNKFMGGESENPLPRSGDEGQKSIVENTNKNSDKKAPLTRGDVGDSGSLPPQE